MGYRYAVLVPPGPDSGATSLWRFRRTGLRRRKTWEYLSLLDRRWHRAPGARRELRPVSRAEAAALEADHAGWARYWAVHFDEHGPESGAPPATVVRRRMSPEGRHDESFRAHGGWSPTQILCDSTDPRPSTVPVLTEISAAEADRVLAERFGVTAATRSAESSIRLPQLSAEEAGAVRKYQDRAVQTAARARRTLTDILATLDGSHLAPAPRGTGAKSLEAVRRQVTVLRSEGVPVPAGLRLINDIVRFTVVFDDHAYVENIHRTIELLALRHYAMLPGSAADSREEPSYKDFRAVWTAPDTGIRIEIQFHTPAGLAARTETQPLYQYTRQLELLPAIDRNNHEFSTDAANFVRASAWWTADTDPVRDSAVATLLGYSSIEEAIADTGSAGCRLAALLGGAPFWFHSHTEALLWRLIITFLCHPPLPPASDAEAVDAVVTALARSMLPDAGDSDAEPLYLDTLASDIDSGEEGDTPLTVLRRVAGLLVRATLIARGDLPGRAAATAPAPRLPTTPPATAMAAILGVSGATALRRPASRAADRLAYLLGIPSPDPDLLRTLARLLDEFAARPDSWSSLVIDDFLAEAFRIAGLASRYGPDFVAMHGFWLPHDADQDLRDRGRAIVFLVRSAMIPTFGRAGISGRTVWAD
ncbi:hypothetical protein H0264_11710 [Nocardia huaxiensis]|uniref:Uncharacterized protein n=1 Tax=Nocardia huaxiensis TaxID=2755382 RepID=A0A7D6ZG20_9NOCA|nr:hypothetical protein [Nocardia huaxiensis]QLY32818.1 hypothetical protein H0264_11710 [Nocardia huaxiensis]